MGASAGTLDEESKKAVVAVGAEAEAAEEEEEEEADEADKTTPSEMLPSSVPGWPSLLSPPSLSASSPAGLKSAAETETPPARARVTSNQRHVSLTTLGSRPPS